MASAAIPDSAPKQSTTTPNLDTIDDSPVSQNNGTQTVDHNRESTHTSESSNDHIPKKTSLIGRVTTWSPVLVLENSGSV
ncbi:hypothetical protein FRB91_007155, partial [Serendipita sp. 411]